jgi:hypothetical protein
MAPATNHAGLLPFVDDFNDGDATDGSPGTWLPGTEAGGTRIATSGDMVVTHTGWAATGVDELRGLRDMSMRTQLRFTQVSGNRDGAVVWGRAASPGVVYYGAIDTEGLIAIGITGPSGGFLDSMTTSLDPIGNDVILQFDMLGDRLNLTAWQEGTVKPSLPQLSATDARLTEGGGLGFTLTSNLNGGSAPAAVVFRYFAVNAMLSGDFNRDGTVDAIDYVVWRKGLGTSYIQADYDVWRTNFGNTAGSGAAGYPLGASAEPLPANVPEPSSFVILTAVVAAAGNWRRRWRGSQ